MFATIVLMDKSVMKIQERSKKFIAVTLKFYGHFVRVSTNQKSDIDPKKTQEFAKAVQ